MNFAVTPPSAWRSSRTQQSPLSRRAGFAIALTALALAALLLAGYRDVARLGFASEDFLILGHLVREPLPDILLDGLRAPWLGMSFVRFYRPVSTALLALAVRAFGLEPAALHLGLLFLHGIACMLVASIACRLTGSRVVALATGAIFAVSPLHPGAVAFIGGYATVLGGLFCLVALDAFLRHLDTGRRWAYGVALGAFALALGAYEAAVVLPAALATLAVLRGPGAGGLKGRLLGVLPFLGLAAGYLLLRRAVLGVFVGGYGTFQDRLSTEPAGLAADLLRSLPRLVVPGLRPALPEGVALGLGAALALGVTLFFLLRRGSDPLATAALGGLILASIFQAPFSFVGVVPATGRFWYLASFAGTLAVLALARGLLGRGRGRLRLPGQVLWTLLAVAALAHAFLGLRSDLEIYFAADREVRDIRQALVRWPATVPGEPLLVAGVPAFARGQSGEPVAKIFQYGLHDAVRPPFAPGQRAWVYPVPPDVAASRLPAAARAAGGTALRWSSQHRRLEPVSAPAESVDRASAQIRLGELAGSASELTFRCTACARVRLFLLTPGAPYRGEWQVVARTAAGADVAGAVTWPRDFLESMARHYGGDVLGWVEDQDAAGRLRAASDVFALPLADFGGEL